MPPRDISSRWDNTPMLDYSTWNLKIVPFVFRVYQRVFIYIVALYTLRYLSKHRVIKIDPGDIHLKLLYLTTVFMSLHLFSTEFVPIPLFVRSCRRSTTYLAWISFMVCLMVRFIASKTSSGLVHLCEILFIEAKNGFEYRK